MYPLTLTARLALTLTALLIVGVQCASAHALEASERPRLAVLTDIGGDPDDEQSLVRLMVYANEFDLELLIASASGTPGELEEAITRPDLIHRIIDAYGAVLPELRRHAAGWPSAESLRARVVAGNPQRGRAHIGASHDTAASRALVERIDAGSPERPLNIAICGGQTDLAQALWRVRHDRGATGLARFVTRFRVYDIADQDGIADWMRAEFPGMFYILSKAAAGRDRRAAVFRGMYLTGDESLTSRAWLNEHVRNRGPLGALYPMKTWTAPNPHGGLKEGDTPSWFFFLPAGGNDPANPSKPGWGGQFVRDADGWFRDPPDEPGKDPRESISRWRPDFQRDFARRMAWCVSASDVRHVISGHVLDPHRVRPEGAVLLVRARDGESISSKSVSIGKDGAFVTPPLSPGTYVLEIARAVYPSAESEGIIGHEIVQVGETDLSGVSIEVRRDTAITGRFHMEGEKPRAEWPTHIVVNAFLALDGMPLWHGVVAEGASGGRFVLRNAFGPRVVRPGYVLARGHAWWPSTVTLDGVDITNVPTDFSKHEGGRLEVGFTQTPARIVGTVTDANGTPVRAPWIVVNVAERALWQHWATTSEVTRGDAQGRFSLAVIPGTYRVQAVPDTAFDSVKAARKAVLQFASDGVPVSLQEQEVKRVTLTVQEP